MTGTDRVNTIIDKSAEHAVRDMPARRTAFIALVVLVLSLATGAVYFGARFAAVDRQAEAQATQIHELGSRADDNATKAQVLGQQVRELGGTPRVSVPTPGERGPAGVSGPPGPPGRDGRDGRDGQNPPCLSQPPQCQGANGQDGQQGSNGTGVQGPPGVPGKDGKDGQDGQPGQNGAPPAGWTWTDTEGRTQTCTRIAGSPDTAPTYSCTANQPPPSTPLRLIPR